HAPLKSYIAIENGALPVAKFAAGAKLRFMAPGADVFRSTDTESEPAFATARSGQPSPSTSPTATEYGAAPTPKLCAAARLGATAPGAVVSSSTVTVLTFKPSFDTVTSGRP